jgi:hypothetical protein
MKNTPTANQLSGRATGAIFFAAFGAIWVALGLYAKERLNLATASWLAMDLLVLLVSAVWLMRQAKRFEKLPDDPARGRAFGRINLIQWVAIAIVALTLGRLRLEAYVMCAITLIVGAHLFPLARLFRYPLHYVTGGALVAWAGVSAAIVPVEQLQGTTAMGTGIILLASSFTTLAIAGTAVRRAGMTWAAR